MELSNFICSKMHVFIPFYDWAVRDRCNKTHTVTLS